MVKLTGERFPRLSIVTSVRDDGDLPGAGSSRRVAEQFLEAIHDVMRCPAARHVSGPPRTTRRAR